MSIESVSALLSRLDVDQAHAVMVARAATEDLRFAAGAGSGKTFTLIALVAALLVIDSFDPRALIVTTFTKKAADEMSDRLQKQIGTLPTNLRIGTFHKLGLAALRRADPMRWSIDRCIDIPGRADGLPSPGFLWTSILGWGSVKGTSVQGLNLDIEGKGLTHKDYALDIGKIRADGIRIGSAEARSRCAASSLPALHAAWQAYVDAKEQLHAFDFDDVLACWLDALEPSQGGNLVVIDEAQDNNKVQIEIGKRLARGTGRLILIGDEKQAIFAFRGASPETFCAHPAQTLPIRGNYRSGKLIVEMANRIAEGQSWASLGAVSVPMRTDDGAIEAWCTSEGPLSEAERVMAEIDDAIKNKCMKPKDYAVLVRTNAVAGLYEAAAIRAGVPCVVAGKMSFFERKEVQTMNSYLLLSAMDSASALASVINRPKRYLGKAFLDAVAASGISDIPRAIASSISSLKGGSKDGARELASFITQLRGMQWAAAIDAIEHTLTKGLSAAADTDAEEDRLGMYATVGTIARKFNNAREYLQFVSRALGKAEADARSGADRVTISTVHRAKGLQWDTVFVSANYGTFPFWRAEGNPQQEAEEARLFYVACTRPESRLVFCSAALNDRNKLAGPSAFTELWFGPSECEGENEVQLIEVGP